MKNKDLSISSEIYYPTLAEIKKIGIRQIKLLENFSIQVLLLNGHVLVGSQNSGEMTNEDYGGLKYFTTLKDAECHKKNLIDAEIKKHLNEVKRAEENYQNILKKYL